jgi:hypothetical protein
VRVPAWPARSLKFIVEKLCLDTVVKWLGILLAAMFVTVLIEAMLGLDTEHEPIGGIIYVVVFMALVKVRAIIHDARREPDKSGPC